MLLVSQRKAFKSDSSVMNNPETENKHGMRVVDWEKALVILKSLGSMLRFLKIQDCQH